MANSTTACLLHCGVRLICGWRRGEFRLATARNWDICAWLRVDGSARRAPIIAGDAPRSDDLCPVRRRSNSRDFVAISKVHDEFPACEAQG